jgi:hypothetical protein
MRSLRLQKLFGQISAPSQLSRKRTKPQWRPQVETMEGRMLLAASTLSLSGAGTLTYNEGGTAALTISAVNVGVGFHPNLAYQFAEASSTITPTYPAVSVNSRVADVDEIINPNPGIQSIVVNLLSVPNNTVTVDLGASVPLTINGGGRGSHLIVNDQGGGTEYDVSNNMIIANNGAVTINYDTMSTTSTAKGALSTVMVNANSYASFYVSSTAAATPITLNGLGASFVIGENSSNDSSPSTLDGIKSLLTLNGNGDGTVYFDDSGSTDATNTYSVGSNRLDRDDYGTPNPPAVIYYNGMASAEVNGGMVGDVFYVRNIETPITLVGGVGSAAVGVSTTFGMFDASGSNPLHPLTLVGQSGHDWLNYNSYVGPGSNLVTVNLANGTATGTTSISGINNVLGSRGPGRNYLTGGQGNNVLVGGSTGENILVAGKGNDVLIGGGGPNTSNQLSARGDFDLMIPGYTIYDYNLYQLDAIGNMWGAVTATTFSQTIKDFTSSIVTPGYYPLNTSTVFSNTGYDTTFVGDGTGAYGQGDLVFDLLKSNVTGVHPTHYWRI